VTPYPCPPRVAPLKDDTEEVRSAGPPGTVTTGEEVRHPEEDREEALTRITAGSFRSLGRKAGSYRSNSLLTPTEIPSLDEQLVRRSEQNMHIVSCLPQQQTPEKSGNTQNCTSTNPKL